MKTEHCDYCFKPLNKDENYGSIDNLGRGGTFCSPACREKWQKKLNEQDYQDFIRWFKSQNIKQIILTAKGEIKIEYYNQKREEEIPAHKIAHNQHKQQLKTAKRYLQQNNESSLDQQKLNSLVNKPLSNEKPEKPKDHKIWIGLGGGLLVVVGVLIGWLIARKKRNY